MRTRSLSLALLLAVWPAAPAARAGDLPAWDDDSGLALTAEPQRFDPSRGSVVLTGRIYHPIDTATIVRWSMSIQDAAGRRMTRLSGDRLVTPGDALEVEALWDGRGAGGALVPAGLYRIVLEVEMAGVGARPETPIRDEEGGPRERTRRVRQRTAGHVVVDFAKGLTPAPAVPANEPGFPYNFYFGTLHNQTSYSDGGHPNDSSCASSATHPAGDFDPAQAYNYARNTAHLDFLGITDHNHYFDNTCTGCSAAQMIQRYHDGLAAAASATINGSFVGIYGMEWGYIGSSNLPNRGHINLYETPKLFGWEPAGCTTGCYWEVFTDSAGSQYAAMYTKALANPSPWGAFGQFNHPSDGTKYAAGQGLDFNNFVYTTDADDLMHTIAVVSGPATGFSTAGTDTGSLYAGEPVNGAEYAGFTSIDMYNRALSAGFHLAPVADPDVHCANYGTSTRDRTVIQATSLTKAALFDAMHNRRVYAAQDTNAQLVYSMIAGGNTYYMGAGGIRTSGPVPTSGSITLHTSVFDPDGTAVSSIKIKEPIPGATDGSFNLIAEGTASPFDFAFTPAAGNHVYYVYVTMSNGSRLWSAPIWINQSGTQDTTPPTTSITSPVNGATVSGTITVSASASDNVAVTRVEFLLDGVLQATDTAAPYQWSWNTTAVSGSHALVSKAYDAANNVGTSASINVTVGGAGQASYDPTLKAPRCASVSNVCDSGASLLTGRANLGPEPGQPNTINNSCADGTSGAFHSDESNDRLKVSTADGTSFAAGKTVRIDATVWAWSTPSVDKLDLYYAANAASPTWTLVATLTPTAAGAQTLSATYTLPSGSLQAVRANFRYQGSASACSTGAYDDHDDLIFAVGAGAPDTTPPNTSITAPASGATVSGTTTVTASASDNVGVTKVEFYVDSVLKGTDTTSPYSFAWNTTAYANGSHSLASKAYDAANNVRTSATVTVTVSNGGPVTVFYDGAESTSTTATFSSSTNDTQWFRHNASAYAGGWRYRAGNPANAGGDYGNNGDARLTTPALDLTGATTATLSYAFKHSTESGYDYFQVRISTDGGTNWTNLVNVSGQSSGWNGWAPLASINLNAYAGRNNVKIQFRVTTDVSVTEWGAALDEIKVVKQ